MEEVKKAVWMVVLLFFSFAGAGPMGRCCAQEASRSGSGVQGGESLLAGPVSHAGDWVKRFTLPGQGAPSAIASDADGNLYVTGGATGPDGSIDFTTLKYDSNGNLLWMRQYNGPAQRADWPVAIVVDGEGSVIVAGNSEQAEPWHFYLQAYDLATVKYDSEGNQLWANVHRQSGNEAMVAVGLDGDGNVYVTGTGSASGGSLTIKYAPKGKVLWKKHIPGRSIGLDAMRVEADGRVTLVGSIWASSILSVLILRYDPQGNVLFEKRDIEGSVTGAVFDAAGNIYVSSAASGYGVIKYDPDGGKLWEAFRDIPVGYSGDLLENRIAVDGAGSVSFTGTLFKNEGGYAYQSLLAARFDGNGKFLWEKRVDGSAQRAYRSKSLQVDPTGNLYLTAASWPPEGNAQLCVLSYDVQGGLRWLRLLERHETSWNFQVPAALDGSGNLLVAGTLAVESIPGVHLGGTAFETLKYTAAGILLWERRFMGPSHTDNKPAALVLDANGNAVVAGTSVYSSTGSALFTMKYAPDGKYLAVMRTYPYASSYPYRAKALAVDPSGNVFVTGTATYQNLTDILTVKYGLHGYDEWIKTFDGTAKGNDVPAGIALDPDGNVVVAGESMGVKGHFALVTLKFDPNGAKLWRRYYEVQSGDTKAEGIAVDASGNVYVTGETVGANGKRDIVTLKFDPSGNRRWVRRFDGQVRGDDIAHAIALDEAGNVYVAGESTGSRGDPDCILLKYTAAGALLWNKRYDGRRGEDRAEGVAIDRFGNVFVVGESRGPDGSLDTLTIKYESSGTRAWVQHYAGEARGDDRTSGIGVDASGNVYLTGSSLGLSGDSDMLTLKYDPDGVLAWVERYDGTFGDDRAKGIAVDGAGNVTIAGESMGSNGHYDWVTLRIAAR